MNEPRWSRLPHCHWSSDDLLAEYPCVISLNHLHNHRVYCVESLRHRTPSMKVEEVFKDLFKRGHSPSSALNSYMFELQQSEAENFFKVQADGAKCPKLKWCYNLYYKVFQKKYGEPDEEGMLKSLEKFVEEYNHSSGSVCAKLDRSDKDIIIAICSPLMKRVHELLPSAAEILFMDAGGTMDRHNCRVFLLLTPSIAGGLPVGILITTSETEMVISRALALLKTIMPDKAFYERGKEVGPKLAITDDSTSERNSLKTTFQDVLLLLCTFHVLQALWRYLWDGKHKVQMNDRTELFALFRNMLYAKDVQTHCDLFEKAMKNTTLLKYHAVEKYFREMECRASEWALCHRNELLTRGHNTNNISEANIRVCKDQILERTKAFNVVQLFDFLSVKLNLYFERRIASVLNKRLINVSKSHYFIREEKLKPLSCKKVSDDVYEVKNSESGGLYRVNPKIEMCTCPVGFNGAPCKHQFAVCSQFGLSSNQFVNCDATSKLRLHKIMTGSTAEVPEGWYDGLEVAANDGLSSCSTPDTNIHGPSQELPSDRDHIVVNPDTVEDDDIKQCQQEWEKWSKFFRTKIVERPDVFVPALNKFMNTVSKTATKESCLTSALHTFGTPVGALPTAVRTGRTIPVNNHAVARRQVYLDGRKKQHTGRPPKTWHTHEHGYNKQKRQADPSWAQPPQKKAAPHSLAHCTSVNIALS